MKLRTTFCLLITLFILLITGTTSDAQVNYMYWVDIGVYKIQRATMDGSNVEDLVTGLSRPVGIAADIAGGKMYWTDRDSRNTRDPAAKNSIQRANLDGTNVETLILGGNSVKEYIVLDVSGGKMYWTDWGHFSPGKIQRANLDGSNVEDIVTGLGIGLRGIALDISGGKIYWADSVKEVLGGTTVGQISRANLDGSNIEDLLSIESVHGIALDVAGGKIYWANPGPDKIQRANLDGSNLEDIVVGLDEPFGVALDSLSGKVYWSDILGGKIQRANLDGTNVEDLVTGLRQPIGIALGIPQTPGLRLNPNVIDNQTFTVGTPVSLTLPTATGGTSPYTYSLAPQQLPAGLWFDPIYIVGTPTTPLPATPFTYTATDATGAAASLTFTITVQDTPSLTDVYMYWTVEDEKKIQRANLDGTNIQDIVTRGLETPESIALDIAGGKMYWTDTAADKIQRANLDGTNVEDIRIIGVAAPEDIALDLAGGKIYWSDNGTDKIRRANLDGTNPEDLVTGVDYPEGIALDLVARKLYWANYTQAIIQRANLDGTNIENVVTTGLSRPDGLAIDTIGGKLYWTDHGTVKIRRVNLDGTNPEDLVTANDGLTVPDGIALDVVAGKMYWTDHRGIIQRANLDGTNPENLVTNLGKLKRIALGIPQPQTGGGLRFDPNLITDQNFTLGAPVSLTLPMATGGSPPYTYNTSALPPGLQFDPADRSLSGTPTTLGTTAVTYTATDAIGASASLTFTITVEDNLDVNADGKVDVLDLVWVAVSYGMRGTGLPADVNADGIVNIQDLVAVAAGIDAGIVLPTKIAEEVLLAAALDGAAGAPVIGFNTRSEALSGVTAYRNVANALADAKHLAIDDVRLGEGVALLETLLQVLAEMKAIPETTALLPNYPNPFNPETWIPYHLATDADVTLTIYDIRGVAVRQLVLGHQPAGVYESRGRAAYWDGKNQIGETVASGLYFYTLTAGDFNATRKLLIAK